MNPPNGWSAGASRSRLPGFCVARLMQMDGWTSAPDLCAQGAMPVQYGFSGTKLRPCARFCQYLDLLILWVWPPRGLRRRCLPSFDAPCQTLRVGAVGGGRLARDLSL